MTTSTATINLDNLSKPERQALNWTALNDQGGHPSPFEELARAFGSPHEAQVRLDALVKLGWLKRVRGGFRPYPQVVEALKQSVQAVRHHQDGLSSVMREHRSAHPNCFLAVAEGKLVDYDPMLAALLLRTRDLRSTTHVTIIPPLSG